MQPHCTFLPPDCLNRVAPIIVGHRFESGAQRRESEVGRRPLDYRKADVPAYVSATRPSALRKMRLLVELPHDILLEIFARLAVEDVLRLRQVCA